MISGNGKCPYNGNRSKDNDIVQIGNDTPYEHNAGLVYNEFVSEYIDIAFPYDWWVVEAADDWRYNGNSPYCKYDMIDRKVPCIIAVPPHIVEHYWEPEFSILLGDQNSIKFYMGDEVESSSTMVMFSDNSLKPIPSMYGKLR